MKISIYSEIGKLEKILLHRPGNELENLSPYYLSDLLFDDIPYLEKAQQEHDYFANLLQRNGVEVLYLTKLLKETLEKDNLKEQFLNEFLDFSDIKNDFIFEILKDYLFSLETEVMINKIIAGVRSDELEIKRNIFSLRVRRADIELPFFLNPMPNLYFQRDPVAMVGKGACINRMKTYARRREVMLTEYIIKYHDDFKETEVYYERNFPYSIEGGDILVLSDKVLAIGISQRTSPEAVEILAKKFLKENRDSFEKILAFIIPDNRAYMHLDTIFTMVDYDKFLVHANLRGDIDTFVIYKTAKGFDFTEEEMSLEEILKRHLNLDRVQLIKCGNGDIIASHREQWNDGSNCLAIEPGKVISYDRNYVTNRELENAGVEVLAIPSSELSRGRGGPRCASMPLIRRRLL
ncbi:arginine deiminase [Petrotoga sp. 9PWA.NaAc.5.4]|uniref:arginine deiminase n=1 Tax=Petrotoga sp. 9PWA.NaAc.5.4 TaxID=1434328 RepID=UPI000CC1F015|nr:arginine deiminase [Petrotoga sp. 9PWA.NaAc.5.4]PNR92420.1 arginine deiminase [Petrotoga sp. 9PWA.NaAc.5.4]